MPHGYKWRACKPWSPAEREARHSLFREASRPHVPPAVLEDRDRRSALELTANMLMFGDPPPGRSALDQRNKAPAV
jgi:hypothetical protein